MLRGLALLLVLFVVLGWWFGLYEELTFSNLVAKRAQLLAYVSDHFVMSVGLYFLIYALAVAGSFPGASFMTIAGGFLFGSWVGGAVAVAAATAGAVVVFLIARTLLEGFIHRHMGSALKKFSDGYRKDAFSYLLFLRLTPIFPFWLVNVGPALLGTSLKVYFWSTLIGIIPGSFAFSFLGSGLDSVIAAHEVNNPGCASAGTCNFNADALMSRQLILALVLLGCVSLIPIVAKRLFGAGRRRSTES
ncbi:MAG: TVP38/TMEM64 family protein [Rhodobacteraceae bacterium]|nr:TVP38/TMEM64 family protein [Paracoccaceae bacterium]